MWNVETVFESGGIKVKVGTTCKDEADFEALLGRMHHAGLGPAKKFRAEIESACRYSDSDPEGEGDTKEEAIAEAILNLKQHQIEITEFLEAYEAKGE